MPQDKIDPLVAKVEDTHKVVKDGKATLGIPIVYGYLLLEPKLVEKVLALPFGCSPNILNNNSSASRLGSIAYDRLVQDTNHPLPKHQKCKSTEIKEIQHSATQVKLCTELPYFVFGSMLVDLQFALFVGVFFVLQWMVHVWDHDHLYPWQAHAQCQSQSKAILSMIKQALNTESTITGKIFILPNKTRTSPKP